MQVLGELVCELVLGLDRKLHALHIQLQQHYQSRHLLYYMLQFGCVHQEVEHDIDQMWSNHPSFHFVQS